jgi:hypothetical protein
MKELEVVSIDWGILIFEGVLQATRKHRRKI